jgi:rhodanese-related sulfurtransferase
MKALLTLLLLLVSAAAAAQNDSTNSYISLEPYDFHLQYLREDTALMIDVREFFEFRGKRIADAVNIPSSGNLDFAGDTLSKDLALFLYCTTDYRSIRVAEKFGTMGFRKVYNLKGGIVQWRKDGFPVQKTKVRRR